MLRIANAKYLTYLLLPVSHVLSSSCSFASGHSHNLEKRERLKPKNGDSNVLSTGRLRRGKDFLAYVEPVIEQRELVKCLIM